MKQTTLQLGNKQVQGYEVALGPVNLVFAKTDAGMVACGAIDVAALDRFNYPAARVKATRGTSIANLDDLLAGEVKDVNESAKKLGLQLGMSGREALERL